MREVVIDTETTGLSYKNGDRIIEVGCVELINHVATNNFLQFYCKVDKEISESAQKITGITNRFLSNKNNFSDHHQEFLGFISNDPLIIHNADFDVGFINNELRLVKRDEIKKEQVIDSLEIAREKYPGASNSLDALCKRFNIDLSRRIKHNALLDCELLREVYINLLGVKEPKLVFSNDKDERNISIQKNLSLIHI